MAIQPPPPTSLHTQISRELLSTREAAFALGVGISKFKELIRENEITSVKIGRARRIHRAEIERYIAALSSQ